MSVNVRTLYRKLLTLYPQRFKEQVGESMEQTFNDLYTERRAESIWSSFVLRMFAETGIGILREHVLLITEGAAMKTMALNPKLAPAISFVLCVLPFMVLEWATRSNAPRSDASPMLWIVLWLLSTGFVAPLMFIVRTLRAGNRIWANPVSMLLQAILLVLLAWLWGTLVIDQMPCFLGSSGC
jgi:hypothetical protein